VQPRSRAIGHPYVELAAVDGLHDPDVIVDGGELPIIAEVVQVVVPKPVSVAATRSIGTKVLR
jgi:hypothetical protein